MPNELVIIYFCIANNLTLHYITLHFLLFIHQNLFIMKKFMILLAVACLVFVSCGNKPEPVVEETTCEFTVLLEKWATIGELDEEGQMALVAEFKAYFDEACKEKCKKEGEETEEICPEKQAEMDAFKAQWEDFANLDLEAQKAIIEKCIEHHKCCKEKEAEVAEEVVQE